MCVCVSVCNHHYVTMFAICFPYFTILSYFSSSFFPLSSPSETEIENTRERTTNYNNNIGFVE